MPRALVLRHHLEDNPGLIGEAFAERGFEFDVTLIDAQSSFPSLDRYDVLVILGSTSSVYDSDVEAAWFGRELDFIGEAVNKSVPILGICFGAQALCRFHGGVVTKAREGEVGWFDIDVVGDVSLSSGPWFEYHFDQCSLPESAQLWASSPRAVQAFAIGRNVGVQFHPEIDDVQLKDWFESDAERVGELGLDVDALLEQTTRETPAARLRAQELVNLFLRHVA
jgi:GMP synthase-like glutamine amidotransferase